MSEKIPLWKMSVFERAAATNTALTIKDMALLLCGLDPEIKVADVPQDRIAPYEFFNRHMAKLIRYSLKTNNNGMRNSGPSYDSQLMFAMAYPLIDPDITPIVIQKKCLECVSHQAGSDEGKDLLIIFGGSELKKLGTALNKSKRGMHRKDDERDNSERLLGVLVKLLACKGGNKYGTSENPNISMIYNDMADLLALEEISITGLAKSTVSQKLSNALRAVKSPN